MGGGTGRSDSTPGKSKVSIGFLRHFGTDHPREAIGPLGSNCLSREVRAALSKIHDDPKKLSGPF